MRRIARLRAVLAVAVGLILCGGLGVAQASAATGSISGTVKSAAGDTGIAGIWVCASSPNFGVTGGCEQTDSAGKYTIASLQPNLYRVAFEEEGRQNYLAQWYPGKPIVEEAELVQVQSGEEVAAVDATLAVGGQIAGRVTDLSDGEPIEGIEVCAEQVDRVTEFGVIPCDKSDADGNYTIQAMPTGQFKLEFGPAIFQRGAPNYIRQYYPGRPSRGEAEVFGVAAGSAYSGFDAVLQPGVGIAGTVSEVGGGPVSSGGPRICALDATTEAIVQCTGLEMDGTYWIPGLPYGAYKVSFAVDVEEEPGLILHPDGFARQYYKGKPTFGEAELLSSSGPTIFSGIDAQLVRGPETFPDRRPVPQPIVVTSIDRPPAPSVRCRKGSRKKFVRGKRRCVKVHRHHRNGRPHGPRAHATDR